MAMIYEKKKLEFLTMLYSYNYYETTGNYIHKSTLNKLLTYTNFLSGHDMFTFDYVYTGYGIRHRTLTKHLPESSNYQIINYHYIKPLKLVAEYPGDKYGYLDYFNDTEMEAFLTINNLFLQDVAIAKTFEKEFNKFIPLYNVQVGKRVKLYHAYPELKSARSIRKHFKKKKLKEIFENKSNYEYYHIMTMCMFNFNFTDNISKKGYSESLTNEFRYFAHFLYD